MSTSRRALLAGLAGLGASTVLPAWAQFEGAIRPQSDPWAQVDPYANERAAPRPFGSAAEPPAGMAASQGENLSPERPSPEEMAGRTLGEALTDPEGFEIRNAAAAYHFYLVERPDKGQGPVLRNRAAQNALMRFCQPFFAASDRPHLPWQVLITDTPMLNGCAFGGGKIAITSGLIAHADHPAELASVVAHEVGHVDFRHSAKSEEVAALMALNKNKTSPPGEGFGKEVLEKLYGNFEEILLTGYGREQEFEADRHVVTMLDRLGMDPGRQIVMWQKMIKKTNRDLTRKTCLLDSHPVMLERMQALRVAMGGEGNPRAQNIPPGWAELKRILPTPADYRWG